MLIDRIKDDRLAGDEGQGRAQEEPAGHAVRRRDQGRQGARRRDRRQDDSLVREVARRDHRRCSGAGLDAGAQRAERAILEAYLPQTLGEDELRASIAEIVAALPERSPKAMGQVMAALKARHGDALDSRTASGLVRAALS